MKPNQLFELKSVRNEHLRHLFDVLHQLLSHKHQIVLHGRQLLSHKHQILLHGRQLLLLGRK